MFACESKKERKKESTISKSTYFAYDASVLALGENLSDFLAMVKLNLIFGFITGDTV